jgi:hypothetical protein
VTPLIATSMSSGSKRAVVVPIAARIRPQLGSLPKIAHLTRLLRAMARPTSSASRTEAAPRTSTSTSWWAPSASVMSWRARLAHTLVSAAVSSATLTPMPEAPEAKATTVSLVDWQPSESIRSKVNAVARRSASSRTGAETAASVVRTTSIVASAGASIPAPLAIPATDQPVPSAAASFGTESVVMIARAAAGSPSADRAAAATSTPGSSCCIGSRSPISPVEQTTTSPAPTPSTAATFSAVWWVSTKPRLPVHALAPPELRITASARPSETTWRDHWTGAAWTRLEVKTAAT